MAKQTTNLNIRLSPRLIEAVRRAAEAEGLTVSAWVKRLLTLNTQGTTNH